jgi:hypothetical protein
MITKNELKKMSKRELLRALELATSTPDLFINATKDLQPPVIYERKDPTPPIPEFEFVPTASEFPIIDPPSGDPSPSSDPVLESGTNPEAGV